jgi:ABC-type sugar transport system ATPase subunit
MDEPLSNLDAKLRLEMRYELQRLHVETGSTFVYVTHDQMEAMTLATQICLVNNGVLQQYDVPLTVYNEPANTFVADFVGNPSINFIEANGKQTSDGSLSLTLFDGQAAVFRSCEALDLPKWFDMRDADEAARAEEEKKKASQKGHVEKGNKDEVFRYHIDRVEEDELYDFDVSKMTHEDLLLGVRPEFIQIAPDGELEGEVYGVMPTGMETTVKIRIGNYLLTGVVFGSDLFEIGSRVRFRVTGEHVMLFDRKSGRRITVGSLSC